jgi:hypothetical protein
VMGSGSRLTFLLFHQNGLKQSGQAIQNHGPDTTSSNVT